MLSKQRALIAAFHHGAEWEEHCSILSWGNQRGKFCRQAQKSRKEQRDHGQLTQPQPVLTGIMSGIAPCARGECYGLCFQVRSDSSPRTLPHSTSYLRMQSPLYSFPALSQSRRCQMWYTPDPPALREPSLAYPLSYSRERANSSAVLVPELAPWTHFTQLPLGSLCNLGWAAATYTEALQVHSR